MRLYIVGKPIEELELSLLKGLHAKPISRKEYLESYLNHEVSSEEESLPNQEKVRAFATYDEAEAYAIGLRHKAGTFSHFPKGKVSDSKVFPIFSVEFANNYALGERKVDEFEYNEKKQGLTVPRKQTLHYYDVDPKQYEKIVLAEFAEFDDSMQTTAVLNITKNYSDIINEKIATLPNKDRIVWLHLKNEIDKEYNAGKTEEVYKHLTEIGQLLRKYNTTMVEIHNIEADDQLSDSEKKKSKAKCLKEFSKSVNQYEKHFMNYSAGQNILRYALAFVGGLVGAAVLAAAGLGVGALLGGAAGTVICPVFGNLAAAVTAGSVSGVAGAIQGFGMGAMVGMAAAEALMAIVSARLTFRGSSKLATLFGSSEQKAVKGFGDSLENIVKDEVYKKPVMSK